MPEYVVHIGLPKTGTKYLQNHFKWHSEFLGGNGVYYPREWWKSPAEVHHDGLLNDLRKPASPELDAIFAGFNASAHRTILISCEGLGALDAAGRERLKALTAGNPVKIVFFPRRWSDWIPSAWQQNVKQGSAETFPEFLADRMTHIYQTPSINFAHFLEGFVSTFGRESLNIVAYSDITDMKLDSVEVFYRHVLGFAELPEINRKSIHSSLGMQMAELIRCLNALELERRDAPGVAMFQRLDAFRKHSLLEEPVQAVLDAMDFTGGSLEVDDSKAPLLTVYNELTERYRDRIIDIGAGQRIFAPRKALVKYIRSDYLLAPGIAARVREIHETMASLHDQAGGAGAGGRGAPASTTLALRGLPGGLADVPPAGPLPPVFSASFGADDGTAAMLAEGWSAPEKKFTWTSGNRAVLRLPRPTQPGNYRLRLAVRPYVQPPKLTAQPVGVQVNGVKAANLRISATTVIECDLPWPLLDDKDAVTVVFTMPAAGSPHALTGAADRRVLGIRIDQADMQLLPEAAGTLPDGDLMQGFESLGANCEFGLVQRRCGVDPLGLLRFANTPLAPLMAALRGRFEGVGEPGSFDIEVEWQGREYMVRDQRYGLYYHAWVQTTEATADDVAKRELTRLPLLTRKLIEDLTEGLKIFVFRSGEPISQSHATELAKLIRSYGPGTLLWVDLADAQHPPGSVTKLAPGLLKGFMDRFAPNENAHDVSLACWLQVCREANRLNQHAKAIAS